MKKNVQKIITTLLLATVFAAPSIAKASDAEGFRFLFPPSDRFDYVEKKLPNGCYLVHMGKGGENGSMNVCDQRGQLLSGLNFENVTMTLDTKMYVLLKSGNLAIIDLVTHAARQFVFSTVINLSDLYESYGNRMPIYKDGNGGIADLDGNVIIPPDIYYAVNPIDGTSNYYASKQNGGENPFLYGVLDKAGNEIIPAVYKDLSFSAPGEVTVENQAGEWGILNSENGESIVPFAKRDISFDYTSYANMYERAWAVIDGKLYRRVVQNGKAGLMDSRFNIVVPYEYDELSIRGNGAIVAKKDGKYGAFTLSGNEIFPFEYNDIDTLVYLVPIGQDGSSEQSYILEDLFSVKKDSLYGLYNINKDEILPPEYTEMWANGRSRLIYLTNAGGKHGLADFNGKIVTPKFYDSIDYLYDNDMYLANDAGKFAVYKKDGELVYNIKGIYGGIGNINLRTHRALILQSGSNVTTVEGKIGLASFDGNMLIPLEYSHADVNALVYYPHVLNLDVSVAKKDGKWGALDSEGNTVVPFNTAERFVKGESDENYTYEVYPKLAFEAKTGRLTGISFEDEDNPPEFVVHSFKGSEYYGSFLGKGAVLITG